MFYCVLYFYFYYYFYYYFTCLLHLFIFYLMCTSTSTFYSKSLNFTNFNFTTSFFSRPFINCLINRGLWVQWSGRPYASAKFCNSFCNFCWKLFRFRPRLLCCVDGRAGTGKIVWEDLARTTK